MESLITWHGRPMYFDNNGFPRYEDTTKIIVDYPSTPERDTVTSELHRIFKRREHTNNIQITPSCNFEGLILESQEMMDC